MKKVLGIIGSPRKQGNTDCLVSRILDGAADNQATTASIFLGELTIQECNGCHVCWTGKACPKNDTMCSIYDMFAEHDILIFGTPVYWYGPTALMKAMIDRFVYFNCPENRKKIKDKKAILVIPYEESDPETVAPVVTFFEKSLQYLEIPIVEKLIIPGVTKKGEVLGNHEIMDRAYEMGKRCVSKD